MTHALFKQIDLTAKLGQDGSSLQAMNALRVIRETVAKHLADTEGAGEIPLERALLALRTIAELPCPEQDDLSAANMRQIALAALGGAGASSEPGNPGAEPVSGPGNAGGRTSPSTTQGSGYSSLAESLNTLERWLDRVAIEDGYVGVPVIEAVEVAVNELRRLRQLERICEGLPQDAIDGGWTVQGIRGYAKRLEDQLKAALAQVEALRAELQSQRERNTELIFKLGSATNGWGRCEKERDAALARVAELERQQPVAWMHDQPNRVDVIHRDVKDLLQRVPGSSRGIHRPLDVSEHYTIPLYAAPVAQAQHSGPEEFSFEYRHPNGESHTVTVSRDQVISEMPDFLLEALCSKFCNCEPVGETNVVECCCDEYAEEFKLLAAAPGKEVPQAWLDVQAERRRQVEVEGWTPEHDDKHSHGQMARAAACYALAGSSAPSDGTAALLVSLAWPWDEQWWKPSTARRDLVKACALALAEIERLDRAGISQSPQPGATTASS